MDVSLLYIIIACLACGLIGAFLAARRGRHPLLWFSMGFLFGVFGVLTLFFLPKVKKSLPEPTPKPPFIRKSDLWLKLWYYLDHNHAQQGPIELPDLIKAWKEQLVSDKSYIWGEGMAEWKRLSELPELRQEFEIV